MRTLLQNPSVWDMTWALKSAGKSFLKGSKVIHQSRLSIRNSIMELKTIFRWQTRTEFSHNKQIKQTLCKARVLKVLERQSFSTFAGNTLWGVGHRGQRSTGSVSSGFVLVVHVQRRLNIRQLHLTHHASRRSRGPAEKMATCQRRDAKKQKYESKMSFISTSFLLTNSDKRIWQGKEKE